MATLSRSKLLIICLLVIAVYLFIADNSETNNDLLYDEQILETEIRNAKAAKIVTYQPPHEAEALEVQQKLEPKQASSHQKEKISRTLKYHKIWQWANAVINIHELFPDTPDVEVVLK